VKVWQKNGGGEQVHEVWCDGRGKMVSMCCGPCTSGHMAMEPSRGFHNFCSYRTVSKNFVYHMISVQWLLTVSGLILVSSLFC